MHFDENDHIKIIFYKQYIDENSISDQINKCKSLKEFPDFHNSIKNYAKLENNLFDQI